VKIFGAIELWKARFHYRQDTVFNASTYFAFLEQLARSYRQKGAVLIQDNATYHKDGDVWAWFDANRHWLEVHQLPPYSPELNPTERLWRSLTYARNLISWRDAEPMDHLGPLEILL
jgi:transposase